MSVTYLGSKTVGAANIAIGLTLPALTSTLSDIISRLASLQGQLTANATAIASPPNPADLAASIAAAATQALGALTSLSLAIPTALASANVSLGADISSLLALKASLQTIVDTLNAAASAGGVHAFKVDALASSVGSELGALTSGGMPGGGLPGARVQGVVLLTEAPATFSAMSTVLLTS